MSLDLLKEEIGQILGERAGFGSPEELPESLRVLTKTFIIDWWTYSRLPEEQKEKYRPMTREEMLRILGNIPREPMWILKTEAKPEGVSVQPAFEGYQKQVTCPKGHVLLVTMQRPAGKAYTTVMEEYTVECPIDKSKITFSAPSGYQVIAVTPLTPIGGGESIVVSCPNCKSKIKIFRNWSLGPKVNKPLVCPICGKDLGVRGIRVVEIIEKAKPPEVPEVAVEIKPWWQRYFPWILGGGVAVTIIAILARRKK